MFVADKFAHIMGGMGFMRDSDAGRVFCDARVNMIYEGTSEINRIYVIARGMLRQLGKGSLPKPREFTSALSERQRYVTEQYKGHILEDAIRTAELAKTLTLYGYTIVAEERVKSSKSQFLSLLLSDLTIGAFAIDSAVRRALRLKAEMEQSAHLPQLIAQVFANEEFERLLSMARQLVQ